MPTLAAIDVGSNAIRMLISRLGSDGKLESIESLRLPVRLGHDAFTSGQFSEATMQMAVDAFLRFRKVAQLFEVSQIRAVATSAMREALNSELLIDRISSETGVSIDLISGEEEARLIHLAVKDAMNLQKQCTLLIDIGGGSVEVLLSDGENILSTESYSMGTVRLLRKLETAGDKKDSQKKLIAEYVTSARRYIKQEIGKDRVDLCAGTGGNLEEMGKLRKRLLRQKRSDVISLEDLDELIEMLGGLSVDERIQNLGLNPDRADVIYPAMIVLQMITREAGVSEVHIPGVGLKDGLILEMASQVAEPDLPRRVQVLASVKRMGEKFRYDAEHAQATARLGARLFEQTVSLHHLTEKESLLLEVAANLHDIGHHINTIDHDKHGYYLLKHHPLIGLTSNEQEIVANLVYYHRKGLPSNSDENFKSLGQKDRVAVTKLCALLRLADTLDISHLARVEDVWLEPVQDKVWRLSLVTQSEGMLEKWSLAKRKGMFEDVFGVQLEILESPGHLPESTT